jgi:hydroxylamine reductase (hybrid-cluster protein)
MKNEKQTLKRKRLGEVLVEAGLIDERTLTRALEIQKLERKKLGRILIGMGVADDNEITKALFTTITNVAWDDDVLIDRIKEGLTVRDEVKNKVGTALSGALPDCAGWTSADKEEIMAKAMSDEVRITAAHNEDVRSLRELLIIGCKGIAAYADHAAILGYEKDDIYGFLMEALHSTTKELSVDEQ